MFTWFNSKVSWAQKVNKRLTEGDITAIHCIGEKLANQLLFFTSLPESAVCLQNTQSQLFVFMGQRPGKLGSKNIIVTMLLFIGKSQLTNQTATLKSAVCLHSTL